MNQTPAHIIIFEPRSDGHHLTWLHLISEAFLSIGMRVTLALDQRPDAMGRISAELGGILEQVGIEPIFDGQGHYRKGKILATLADCLTRSGADEAFLPNLDEIASAFLRAAAIGVLRPKVLRGRLSGVYHRPRSLGSPKRPLGNLIKTIGLHRLGRRGWFRNIYLVDEYLQCAVRDQYPGIALHFIPDPAFGEFRYGRDEARAALGIPRDRFVFLNYGIPARRKGLHLAVQAMQALPAQSPAFLFCAGRTVQDADVLAGLERLVDAGRASVMGRYISDEEEKLSFCACDAVLLPYIGHMGSSAILSRAALAGKAVLASDEGLIAKRVREHDLGRLFVSADTAALALAMEEMSTLTDAELQRISAAALAYAHTLSADAFRAALLAPYLS